MFVNKGFPVKKVICLCRISSSTWYYQKADQREPHQEAPKRKGRPISTSSQLIKGGTVSNKKVVDWLKELRNKRFFDQLGYRKLHHLLIRDYGLKINHKKLYRLYSEAFLSLPKKNKTKRVGKKICENRKVTGPNQLWQFDIKYGFIDGENRFFFLMAFIDTFTREVKHYHVGTKCTGDDIGETLEMALKLSNIDGKNLVIRSDNGSQMTSNVFKKKVESLKVDHEFTPPSTPNLNAYIESFFSIVDRELYQRRKFQSFSEAYSEVVDFIRHYNEERPHTSLKMNSPLEFTKSLNKDNNESELVA